MNDTIRAGVAKWLAHGEVGVSSKTIALYLAFDELPYDHSHPYDPPDFDRCLRLLAAVPMLRLFLPKMAGVSPEWRALVDRWDEIEKSHLDEVGLGWSKARRAPNTYLLISGILKAARASDSSGAGQST